MSKKARLSVVHAAIAQLTRLTELFEQRREQLAVHAGLSVGQWSLLEEISTEQFMPSMFAKTEDRSRAAVSKVIRQLLDRGLIRVAISAADGRQRDYALTDEGRTALEALRARVQTDGRALVRLRRRNALRQYVEPEVCAANLNAPGQRAAVKQPSTQAKVTARGQRVP